MIRQTFDREMIEEGLGLYPNHVIDMNVGLWLASPQSLALEEDGNVGMFEQFSSGVYTGHYFFRDRGKKAKDLAIRMMDKVFADYGVEILRGLTPIDNRPAQWMTRHLGFKDYGEFEHPSGMCTLFMMTKNEFNTLHRNTPNG